MKKLLFVVALGFAGLLSAKNSDFRLNISDFSKEGLPKVKVEKSIKVFGEIKWHYLYQSTCGWTFSISSDVAIQNMTDEQYEDFQDELIWRNNQACKLHGEKPTYNYAFNGKKVNNIHERI